MFCPIQGVGVTHHALVSTWLCSVICAINSVFNEWSWETTQLMSLTFLFTLDAIIIHSFRMYFPFLLEKWRSTVQYVKSSFMPLYKESPMIFSCGVTLFTESSDSYNIAHSGIALQHVKWDWCHWNMNDWILVIARPYSLAHNCLKTVTNVNNILGDHRWEKFCRWHNIKTHPLSPTFPSIFNLKQIIIIYIIYSSFAMVSQFY